MEYSQAITNLINEIQTKTNHPIKINVTEQALPYLRNEQGMYHRDKFGNDIIEINNINAHEYLLTHELLHLWLQVTNYPQLHFNLITGLNAKSDLLLTNITTLLYESVTHVLIHQKQVTMHIWNDKIAQMYVNGLERVINVSNNNFQVLIWQILNMFDALVILGATNDIFAQWQHSDAYRYALELWQVLQGKPINSHRLVVRIFATFEHILSDELHLPALALREFATLTPVLSSRQLRLRVEQVFSLIPSAFVNANTKQQAYLGLGISDHQNSFVLPVDLHQVKISEYLDDLKQQPLMQVLNKYHFAYLQR